jgi:hypothetical protein
VRAGVVGLRAARMRANSALIHAEVLCAHHMQLSPSRAVTPRVSDR